MTFMQRAHRRDEADRTPLAPKGTKDLAQLRRGANDLHCRTRRISAATASVMRPVASALETMLRTASR